MALAAARHVCIACLLVLVSPGGAMAHQDRVLSMLASGEIRGAPARYGKLSLELLASRSEPLVRVRIGAHAVKLPPCLARYFEGLELRSVRATASWYHDPSLLPPYLVLHVVHRDGPHGFFTGVSLMFDLETAALLHVHHHRLTHRGAGMTYEELELSRLCTSAERRTLERPAPAP